MLTGNVGEIDLMAQDATGWAGMLYALRNYLETLSQSIHVDQVKEKFGGLRFYFHVETDIDSDDFNGIQDAVDAIESMSYTTCYVCPSRATHQGEGYWVRWFCDEHDTDDVVQGRATREPS